MIIPAERFLSLPAAFFAAMLLVGSAAAQEPASSAGPAARGAPAPDSLVETVVYTTLRPPNWDLYLFDEPGGTPRRLTDDPALDYNAVFSPDGRWVVFTSERAGGADLYALEMDGEGEPIRLTRHPGMDDQSSFSPDGRRIAFVSTRDADADIFVMPFSPGEATAEDRAENLTRRPGGDFNPAFSPDGRRIAFSRQDSLWSDPRGPLGFVSTGVDLYVMDADGSNARRLSEPGPGLVAPDGTRYWRVAGSPAWSEDGGSIYYHRVDEDGSAVRLIGADGSGDRQVAPLGLSPALRPDGRVAFSRPQPRPDLDSFDVLRTGRIFSVAADGSDLRLESDTVRSYYAPHFDRDSGRMVAHGPSPIQDLPVIGEGRAFAPPGAQGRARLPDRTLEVRGIRDFFPALSAGGELLATATRLFGRAPAVPIHISGLDGSASRELFTPDSAIAWGAAVARDAGEFVVAVGPPFAPGEAAVDIWKVQLDGSGAVNLTADVEANDALPHVSADGSRIAFRSGGDGSGHVYVMNGDGTGRRRLTDADAIETMPALSPDGEWVVFPTDRVGGRKLWIQRVDGSEGRFLEPDRLDIPDVSMHPRFSPDGQWVVFTSDRSWFNDEWPLTWFPQPYGDLWAVPVAGGPAVRLTHNKWEDGPNDWGYGRLPEPTRAAGGDEPTPTAGGAGPIGPAGGDDSTGTTSEAGPPFAVPNDNRAPGGTLRDGVLELDLEARLARWEGEGSNLVENASDPSIVTVLGFAEEGGPVRIPGPLIRVPQGTEVRVRVRNSIPDSVPIGLPGPALRTEGMRTMAGPVLIVRGLRAATVAGDTLHVPRGEVREVRYRADQPGTYFYWATPSGRTMRSWTGRDAQLAGAIVVDPAGTTPDPEERIFVITMIDQLPDTLPGSPPDDMFRRAINGRSWPDTERFHYEVGDTLRWRWINASFDRHPMHLHGFHYRVVARGDGITERVFPAGERPLVVTEHMTAGSTFRMEWVPTRAGNWIFHCHTLDHIVPVMERDEEERAHDLHDPEQHALDAMAGLVLGLTVSDDGAADSDTVPDQRLRLVALEEHPDDSTTVRGFALAAGTEPAASSPSVPGPPLLLTRGETTEITVVNRMSEPTTIHWHGLELESVFDGVAGWSRTGSRIAPLIAPGDSFTVRITPPRAGTFIYHTHMDETDQLAQGMAGPFIVLEPGERFDPEVDRVFLIGGQLEGDYPVTINGYRDPPPMTFRAGTEYRLRFVQISTGHAIDLELTKDGAPLRWWPRAKDGADLPPALRLEEDAEIHTNTGQTFDFTWTPEEPGDATLVLRWELFVAAAEGVLRQTFRVR